MGSCHTVHVIDFALQHVGDQRLAPVYLDVRAVAIILVNSFFFFRLEYLYAPLISIFSLHLPGTGCDKPITQ